MPEYENQIPLADYIEADYLDIVDNTALARIPDLPIFDGEPRCPCILLLDTSYSMVGQSIKDLNMGIKKFKQELMKDPLARKRVEIAVVTFGGSVRLVSDFQTVEEFEPPTLSVEGDTPMGEAIEKAIQMLVIRKAQIRRKALRPYRPWIFLITDGAPTDDWKKAAELVRRGETYESKSFVFFPVGVTYYNKEVLAEISVREPVRLVNTTNFGDLFKWLSDSLSQVSSSRPGDRVELSTPLAPSWVAID